MTIWLKQSTAVDVILGPFVDETDGKTAETGLTLSQADCILIKGAAAAAQKNDATSATHLSNGHYKVPLNATDTGTLGRLRLLVNESGALPVWADYMVAPANVWDSMFGADRLQVHADEITNGLITAAAIGADAITAAKIADGAIDAGAIATGAITAAKFGAGAIDAAAIADNAIDAGAIASNAFTSAKFAAGAITAAAIATNAIDADALAADAVAEIAAGFSIADGALTEAKFTSGALNAIADAVLKRDWTAVSGEAARSVLNALRFLRNKWSVSSGTLTVTKENDTTTAWTAALTDNAAANPITGSDPV